METYQESPKFPFKTKPYRAHAGPSCYNCTLIIEHPLSGSVLCIKTGFKYPGAPENNKWVKDYVQIDGWQEICQYFTDIGIYTNNEIASFKIGKNG